MTVFRGFVNRSRQAAGFTLIELMIVVAIITVILSLALPVYTNYTTRTKVGEALSMAAAAKTATATICFNDPEVDSLTDSKVDYENTVSRYVLSVSISGSCAGPVITVQTQNIGTTPNIVLTLTGSFNGSQSRIDWVCTSNTVNQNVPTKCRT